MGLHMIIWLDWVGLCYSRIAIVHFFAFCSFWFSFLYALVVRLSLSLCPQNEIIQPFRFFFRFPSVNVRSFVVFLGWNLGHLSLFTYFQRPCHVFPWIYILKLASGSPCDLPVTFFQLYLVFFSSFFFLQNRAPPRTPRVVIDSPIIVSTILVAVPVLVPVNDVDCHISYLVPGIRSTSPGLWLWLSLWLIQNCADLIGQALACASCSTFIAPYVICFALPRAEFSISAVIWPLSPKPDSNSHTWGEI